MFGPGLCQNGRCLNTVPGYICLCNPGYHYDATRRMCEGEDTHHPSLPPGPPSPASPPHSCWELPFWGQMPTAAGRSEVRGAVGLSQIVLGICWKSIPGEGPPRLRWGRGGGSRVLPLRYQLQGNPLPGRWSVGKAPWHCPRVPPVFLPPQITTSARTWPVRMASV